MFSLDRSMHFTPFRVPPLNAHYEGEYDESVLRWRRLGAADKGRNLASLLQGSAVDSVLEVGCGTGAVLDAVATLGIGNMHVGVDLADPIHHTDERAARLDLRRFDGRTLPFGDGEFDLVFASHVIEHVPEPRVMLSEMRRVAGKWLYLEVPCELHVRTNHRDMQRTLDIGHINAYTPESFQLLLETSGLKVDRIQLFDHSLAVHGFGTSAPKAWVKCLLRRSLLAASQRLASRVFTYHCGALVAIPGAR
jgi:SAM-dependent methyltransferase